MSETSYNNTNNTGGPNITKASEITDTLLLQQGRMVFQNGKTGHQLFFEQMRKDMDMYDGKFSTQERKISDIMGIPRLFIPKTYVNTQRILVSALEPYFFDPEEIVDVKTNKAVPQEHLQAVKTILNHRLNSHPIDFYQESYEATLNAIRNMIGIFKVYPQVETETVTVQKMKTQTLEDGTPYQTYVDAKEKRIKYFEPRIDCIPPEDVIFSKRSTWKNYWRYPLVHRYKRTRAELRLMGYKNVDQLAEVQLEDQIADVVKYQRRQDYQTLFNDQTMIRDEEEIWVFEHWDFLPGEDGKLKSGSFILLGDMLEAHVVGRKWVENDLPYRFSPFEHNRPPFVLGEAYPEPHRLEGKSYPQITGALQQETNAQRNQEREAIARDLRRTMYINRDANVDLLSLTNRRIGGYVLGDGPRDEAVGEIPTNNSAAILARTQARTDNDYYETGLPPNLLGSDTPGQDTATESTQQLDNANKKIALVIRNLAHTLFLPTFRYLLRLEQAYETDDYIKNVLGKVMGPLVWDSSVPIRDVLQGDFDVQVNIGVNKQQQMNKLLLIMDRLTQANQATAQLVQMRVLDPRLAKYGDPMKVLKEILPLVGIKKLDEFDLPAMAPPPEQKPQGQGSPAAPILDASQQVSNLSPSAAF